MKIPKAYLKVDLASSTLFLSMSRTLDQEKQRITSISKTFRNPHTSVVHLCIRANSVCLKLSIRETFLETPQDLRQLLNLVLAEDFTVYLSEQRRQRSTASYDRVTPGAVIRLLEKMREFDKRRAGILTGLSKQVRERRRRLEDVCRQLKELQASTSSG